MPEAFTPQQHVTTEDKTRRDVKVPDASKRHLVQAMKLRRNGHEVNATNN